jgi:hypothetical protein
MTSDSPYLITYLPVLNDGRGDTIVLFVRYMPDVNRKAMNISIDWARATVKALSKGRGWDGWIKVKEDIEMVK